MSTDNTAKNDWMGRDRLKGRALAEGWGDLFGSLSWQFLITLTFDPKKAPSVNAILADKEAFWWCCQVSRVMRRPLGWLYAVERGRAGRWHVHVLLVGVSGSLGPAPAAMWEQRNGLIDVTPVDHARGAVLYTTKEAALSGEVTFSDTMARYRSSAQTRSGIELFPSVDRGSSATNDLVSDAPKPLHDGMDRGRLRRGSVRNREVLR